jgi:UDP-N-acetylmuramoylalanine--D-glutamate ligase
LPRADGHSPWPQAHVVIAGIGVSGFAAADGLLQFGARVTVLDDVLDERRSDKGKLLEVLGGTVRLGPGATATLPTMLIL